MEALKNVMTKSTLDMLKEEKMNFISNGSMISFRNTFLVHGKNEFHHRILKLAKDITDAG
jgi:hypothetical protein